jgi:outer membrane protein
MKKLLLALVIISSVLGPVLAKEYKVGYIDLDYIIKNYRTAADAQRTFETEISKYKTYADSLKRIFDNAHNEFESQKLMLSDQGKQARQIEIDALKKQYDDYVTQTWGKGGKIEVKNRELIAPINQKITTTIQQIAAKENFSMVLDASEAKIVYAQNELDLTDKILDELNKEYAATIVPGPVPVTQEKIANIAVFPFYQENQEAQQEHVGDQIRNDVYDLVRSAPNVRMIAMGDINNALLTRNINLNNQISDMDLYSIGLLLQADYIISGSTSKQGNRISFNVKVAEPLNSKVIYQGDGSAPRIEELKQALGNLIQQAVKSINPSPPKGGK